MRLRATLLAVAWATLAVGVQPFGAGSVGVAHPSTALGVTLSLSNGSKGQGGQPDQAMPRFRSGANLVRVDAYISKDGVALTDLRPEDVVVYEDDKVQRIENVTLIEARAPVPRSERTDATNVSDMRQQATDAARLFTLFFDRFHVQVSGSYRAQKPIVDTLDRVIGQDDLVGVMTPEISPAAITYSRRTSSIERMVTDTAFWGLKNRLTGLSPQEAAIAECYVSHPEIADEMIARRRERDTLDALDHLVTHLDGLRPERKFVMVFTEGWALYKANEQLARTLGDSVPGRPQVGTDPTTGRITSGVAVSPGREGSQSYDACERERTMLSYIDHEVQFRELLQRANRANVSFYPIDARGLIVFDQPDRWDLPVAVDNAWLRRRHDDLRMMADQTDGLAVLYTNDVSGAMQKIFADIGSYYLLSYYSSNTKLDGRFRRIRVEVKREGADVRARPGYLAPTESEARAGGVMPERPANSRAAPAPPPAVVRALDAIAPGRGNLPVRIQAAGARSSIRAVVEIDAATAKLPEWISGGMLLVTIAPERGTNAAAQTITAAIQPGQRSIPIAGPDAPLPPGRYSVRAEITPKAGRLPIQVTTFATVPADAADVGTGALALRRGPSTGLAYVATADPRFRRTERLRVEVPLMGDGYTGTARLLTREGRPMPLVATYGTRVDDATSLTLAVAELALSPLAAGEYVFELTLAKDGKTEIVTYGMRIVP